MTHSIKVRKMYKYRLYRNDKKDRKLRHKIFVASTIWNHFIALQKRYFRMTGKYITLNSMNAHVLKLRNNKQFVLWKNLHSQSCQDVCKRIAQIYANGTKINLGNFSTPEEAHAIYCEAAKRFFEGFARFK